MSYMSSERHCLKNQDEKRLKKTLDVDLHIRVHICAHTYKSTVGGALVNCMNFVNLNDLVKPVYKYSHVILRCLAT